MLQVLDFTTPVLPQDKPRYLMGWARRKIWLRRWRAVDMFDCVMPTRAGRHGTYTWRGKVNIRNARHANDPRCSMKACLRSVSRYSRAYLHHLNRCGEYLGAMLLSWHNLAFYQEFMAVMRDAIEAGKFEDFRADFYEKQKAGDVEPL